MNKLKIGYFADGPWGHNALEMLLADESIDIRFIVPRNDTHDDYLRLKATAHNIDYLCPVRVNSDEFYRQAETYQCDLFVSMSYNQIFRSRIYNLPPLHTINCHAGKLPFYRGRNILNWALINDEHEFGITVHYVDDGVDTGDIILQRTFPITDADNYNTLLQTAYVECPQILVEAIKQLQAGTANRIPQSSIAHAGLFCGSRTVGDELLDWHQTSREVFNFVRAVCQPAPMATCYCGTEEVKINAVSLVPDAPIYKGIPGQVLAIVGGLPIVKTIDTYVALSEVHSQHKIRVGDRLTMRPVGQE